jgi:CRISPR-associated protein Cmr6
VAAGSHCTLYVQCNPALIPADHAELRDSWRALIEAAIDLAGEWLGFGAKTAVGYGRLEIDPKVRAQREAEREKQERERQQREAEAALALKPADQQLLDRLTQRLDTLPTDPRTAKPIPQLTSGKDWQPVLDLVESHVAALAGLAKPPREALATEIKKRLGQHFKIEGKAEKAMKEKLAAVRGQ